MIQRQPINNRGETPGQWNQPVKAGPAPAAAAPAVTFYLLKEDGDALLLETGDHFLKEDAP